MAVREILLLGNPMLRTRCAKVRTFPDNEAEGVIADLFDTLAEFRRIRGFGRGIAAPQIGIPLRITVINVGGPTALVNPEIVRRSRQMMTLWDDCFSFPEILVKVKRHMNITVAYRDAAGSRRRLEAEGSLSELLQHEIDHLNGILALDRAIDSKHIILRSELHKLDAVSAGAYTL
jgi:peptide deformylase